MKKPTKTIHTILLGVTFTLFYRNVSADQSSGFQSEWFTSGTLVYSDRFDGDYDAERWGPLRKDRKIEEGKLIVMP
ncbi:MAG: hypothetical protein ISQ09_13515, partial [Rubripirellula sp.]|nr:hypothetical protein [Rubripirellula sp.]